MTAVTKQAQDDLDAQRKIIQNIQDRLQMQAEKVQDYRKATAEGKKADDSCFDNPLTSHDVDTIREVVKNIEKASMDFQ